MAIKTIIDRRGVVQLLVSDSDPSSGQLSVGSMNVDNVNIKSETLVDLIATGNMTLGDGASDSLVVSASSVFTAPVTLDSLLVTGSTTLGSTSSDSLTVDSTATVNGSATFNNVLTSVSSLHVSGTTKFDTVAPIAVDADEADPVYTSVSVSGRTTVFLSGNSGSVSGFNLVDATHGQYVLLCNTAANTLKMAGLLDGSALTLAQGSFAPVIFNGGTNSWLRSSGSV